MSGGVYKMTEIVGTSPVSFAEATKEGVKRASKSLRNLNWFQVVEERGLIKDGQVAEFQVTMKIGFKLED
jgi:flavin-binding protein dodecin